MEICQRWLYTIYIKYLLAYKCRQHLYHNLYRASIMMLHRHLKALSQYLIFSIKYYHIKNYDIQYWYSNVTRVVIFSCKYGHICTGTWTGTGMWTLADHRQGCGHWPITDRDVDIGRSPTGTGVGTEGKRQGHQQGQGHRQWHCPFKCEKCKQITCVGSNVLGYQTPLNKLLWVSNSS
jgi:hypothetical protein